MSTSAYPKDGNRLILTLFILSSINDSSWRFVLFQIEINPHIIHLIAIVNNATGIR